MPQPKHFEHPVKKLRSRFACSGNHTCHRYKLPDFCSDFFGSVREGAPPLFSYSRSYVFWVYSVVIIGGDFRKKLKSLQFGPPTLFFLLTNRFLKLAPPWTSHRVGDPPSKPSWSCRNTSPPQP
ncbi:hypothetical protein F2Q69_00014153 [Brassica cretica]|uniref:Uncharacterized protein n=1 Tax=Brassica cretica TaxID=69181 RepID=A0A8S9R5M3_BRACR|nr:hypothetical protein F2Q69_00014153 [Brassica cretica]